MRYFLALVLLAFIAQPVAAQTPVTDAQTQKFYETCSQNRDARMSVDTQNTFCKCSSIGYKNNITQEDLQDLAKGIGQDARNAMNKLVLELYAPCMEFPIRDMVFNKCTKDAFQAGKQLCSCMATKMARYVSERGKGELATILNANPNVYDPLDAITSSAAYATQEKRIVLQCIQGK